MKIIKLSEDDHTLLKAAFDACEEAEREMNKAQNSYKAACAAYNHLCSSLCNKHKIGRGEASDDQLYLIDRYGTSPTEATTEKPE